MCSLTWLCPNAWLSSTQGAETGGHGGLPNTVWQELEEDRTYKCICIYALLTPYCSVLQQDKGGCWQDYLFSRVKLSTNLPRSSKLLWPEKTDFAAGVLAWPGAVHRNDIDSQLSLCPQNTLRKQDHIYQNTPFLEHILKTHILRVKTQTCGFRHSHNIGYGSTATVQGRQWSLGTWLPHPHFPWGLCQPLERGHSLRFWVKQETLRTWWWNLLSRHHQLRSSILIEHRKKVEERVQVSSCPSLEWPRVPAISLGRLLEAVLRELHVLMTNGLNPLALQEFFSSFFIAQLHWYAQCP